MEVTVYNCYKFSMKPNRKDITKMENKLISYSRAGDVFLIAGLRAVALDLSILNHHLNV